MTIIDTQTQSEVWGGHLNKKDMHQAIDAVKKTLKELDIKLN